MNKDNKKFVIETIFLKESLKHKLSLAEFLVLVYFDNDFDSVFDVKKISKSLCLDEKEVIMAFESLLNKKLITMVSIKDASGKMTDKISLDNLYNGIKKDIEEEDNKNATEDFLVTFQKRYGHNLSAMDFEIIKAWIDTGISEELILGAVEEANYNGVSSLRYIDKVLHAWQKKGFKTMKDVNNHLTKKDNQEDEDEKNFETGVIDFDWLDNDDE